MKTGETTDIKYSVDGGEIQKLSTCLEIEWSSDIVLMGEIISEEIFNTKKASIMTIFIWWNDCWNPIQIIPVVVPRGYTPDLSPAHQDAIKQLEQQEQNDE